MSGINLNASKIIGFSTANSPKTSNLVTNEATKTVTIKSDSVTTNTNEIKKGDVPNSLNASGNFQIGQHVFTENIEEIPSGDLEYAKICTDKKNKIDEVFFRTLDDGKLYVVYGDHDNKGSLGNIDDLVPKRRGIFNGKVAEIVHVDNEINTISEGAKGPFVSMMNTLREATESGIVKGVAEVGTTLTALYLGKNLIQNIQTAQTTVSVASNVLSAASTANEAIKVAEVVSTTAKTVSTSRKFVAPLLNEGRTILSTVRTGATGFLKVGLSVTAVVGIVAIGMSTVGAIKGSNPKNDYSTIVEITDPRLATPKKD